MEINRPSMKKWPTYFSGFSGLPCANCHNKLIPKLFGKEMPTMDAKSSQYDTRKLKKTRNPENKIITDSTTVGLLLSKGRRKQVLRKAERKDDSA